MKENPVEQVLATGAGSGAPGGLRPATSDGSSAKSSAVSSVVRASAGTAPAPPRRDSVEISTAARSAVLEVIKAQAAPSKEDGEAKQDGSVSINFNKDLGILQAKIVDPVTHQVIREIPPDEILKMASRIRTFFKEHRIVPRGGDAPELLGSGGGDDGEQKP